MRFITKKEVLVVRNRSKEADRLLKHTIHVYCDSSYQSHLPKEIETVIYRYLKDWKEPFRDYRTKKKWREENKSETTTYALTRLCILLLIIGIVVLDLLTSTFLFQTGEKILDKVKNFKGT